ncbi:hypothetical protein COW99_01695 [Candidatus Roizmanbacteria bacterium CG22_combo_CG10-13_8_21_14_all_38_20]|uniref:Uncharacterized protein n=1 Tax=Candidatus Roizmanbacteria bacterium CG22_combo_CG10-13_8_21_14_all_38_20 TaxID=1974862 RepID=A0A2H0BY82_9BACT|nr:hypothetical protein [bacterium]PIP61918.1 MAG: hypothetical protein COW99_01695 [Candidatus Roizmanbacteria bacterium CG22_combo_CG10-13_8_21_14_all_38_20]PJC32107.1 MAG: hypothetical protein CO050_01260 [Candidatus Roizmanbacteria bacterium CG_4_9_14_0_2_um_filter_38_17]
MLLLLLTLSVLLFPEHAHAYLDPGTGSYVFQILIASIIGGAVVFKSGWSKIVELFKRKPKSSADEKNN